MDDCALEYIFEMLFSMKYVRDSGNWDRFMACLTDFQMWDGEAADMPLDAEYTWCVHEAAMHSIFERIKIYWQEAGELTVYVFHDPVMYRYNQLCRAYEKKTGMVEIENPYVGKAERAIRETLNFYDYSSDYAYSTGTKRPTSSKVAIILHPEFSHFYEVVRGLAELKAFFVEGVAQLEKELTPKKKRTRGKIIQLPLAAHTAQKEAA